MILQNRNYFITGASSGIGKQCATDLLSTGANVLITARREELLKDLLSTHDNDKNMYCASEITDYDKIHEALNDFVSKNGKLDGLVFSTGQEYALPLKAMNSSKYLETFNINTVSALEIIKICTQKKYFNENGGSIVIIASIHSVLGAIGHTAYCASKGALVASARALALEFATRKIRINCISPGIVKTEMVDNYFNQLSDNKILTIENEYPLGFGTTNDISGLVQFLLSDASRWITGQNIIIDGGFSIK